MNQTLSRVDRVGTALDRATKLTVLGWAVAALAMEVWLLRGAWPSLPLLALGGFAAAAILTGIDRRAVGVVLLLAYLFPTVVYFWIGHYYPLYSAVWMALLVGAVTPDALRTPWHLPAQWRGALICWSLVTIAGASIVFAREIDFTPALFGLTSVANTAGGGWPSFLIRFVLHTALVTIVGIMWFDWLIGTPGERFMPAVGLPLAVGALVMALVAVYQLFVDVRFLNATVFGVQTRASGTVFDANICGAVAALWTGGAVLVAEHARRRAALVAIGGMSLGWLAVWASGSRTAFAAAVIVTVFSLIALYVARSRASSFRAAVSTLAAAGATAVILFVLAKAPLGVIGPAARLAPAVSDLSSEALKRSLKENLWDRNRYGAASTAMIARRPWFGVGVGSFQSLLPEFFFEAGGPVPPDNAQNWYRHQLAELGIVGSLPWIAWLLIFGLFALRRHPSAPPHLWTARGILLAFAAISFVGMPGQEPAVAVTFWTMAFWFAYIAGIPQQQQLSRVSAVSIIAVLAVYAAGALQAAVTDLRVPLRAQRVGWPYSHGFSPPLPAQGATGGWTGRRAVATVPATSKWMMLTVSVDHRALVSPDRQPPVSHAPTRPSNVKVWCNGELVLERQLTTTAPVSTYVPVADASRWMLIETWASRIVRLSDLGVPDDRELGLRIDWTFVPQPPDSWTATVR